MGKKQNVDWRSFEEFVARIYKEIDPNAEVSHNQEVEGRQIDVTIRKKVVGIDLLFIIQAKWYKRPVEVTHIDAFESVIKEVGASKGILVCNKGLREVLKKKQQRPRSNYALFTIPKLKHIVKRN
jgi:restriction endonuclease Mrr